VKSNSIYLYNDNIGRVDLIDHMGDDLTIVNSARVSFGVTKDKLDNRDKKLIKYLVKHRHTSTFEHNVVTFRFVVPIIETRNLSNTWLSTVTHRPSSITSLLFVLSFQCLCDLSICVIEHGPITKYHADTQTRTFSFTHRRHFARSTKRTGKHRIWMK
jgi:hypothetical protein